MRRGLVLGIVLLAGCSGKPTQAPPTETVEGKVTAQGRALPFVLVTFNPDDPSDPSRYDGAADKDGSFRLRCPKGRYRVTLNPLPAGSGNAAAGALVPGGGQGEVPARYRDRAKTPLTEEVPAGGKTGLTLEMK
jgi:hypothetical protein